MDDDDRLAEADQGRLDDAMAARHAAGHHDTEPCDDCWVCQAAHGA